MIILITGVPGSGKTLYAVGLIKKYLAESRAVFADIEGINIPGVAQAPLDWRECPDGSVVVYDECQQRFGPDRSGRSENEIIADLEVHRHRGMDIMLITQHPKLLHAHVRRLVGRHYHIFRMYGSETAKVFCRDGHIDVDKPSQLRDQDSTMWSYPKDDFALYQSATLHTYKRKLPAWLKRSGFMVGVLVLATVSLGYIAADFFSGLTIANAQEPETVEKGETVNVESSPFPASWVIADQAETLQSEQVSGCIASETRCLCYSPEGQALDLPLARCRAIAESPPRSINVLQDRSRKVF